MDTPEKTGSNLPQEQRSLSPHKNKAATFRDASEFKNEAMWSSLENMTVGNAVEYWMSSLADLTAKNYRSGVHLLIDENLLHIYMSLQAFSLMNHNNVIDAIKKLPDLSECSKQARAACYISFTRFLNRKTEGMIPKAEPSRDGSNKTFYRVREKVSTMAMNRLQWIEFLSQLHILNPRDALIAKLTLQGGKRLGEVLSLTTDMIDWSQREITFKQSKTKGYDKETVITYPQQVFDELYTYLGQRQGHVFVTRTGKPVVHTQLSATFAAAGIRAQIPFKVTPHVLRASTVTYLKREGFADSDIMKITGHASSHMIHAYDKSERAQNASKKVSLV